MLAIKKTRSAEETRPNLLPCKIQYDGPVPVSAKHWSTAANADGTKTAYFRGRKLIGTDVKLPDGYTGAVLRPTAEKMAERPSWQAGEAHEDPVDQLEVQVLHQDAAFAGLTVWGHESAPDADQHHIKAVQEWISFAESVGDADCSSSLD